MNINSLRYCLRQTFISLSRNAWLAVISASIIAVSLIILGSFILIAVNASQLMHNIEDTVEISVFLYNDANPQEIKQKLDALEGVESYAFVSRHDGLQEFSKEFGEELVRGLEGERNPLPDTLRIRVEQAEVVSGIAHIIEAYPGVEKVRYGEELINWLIRTTRWVNIVSLGISALLAVAAIFLIVTSIRLSLLARQEEIGIMKYLGASNWFVRFPFFLEGLLVGWIGTLFAVIVTSLSYYYIVAVLQRTLSALIFQPVTDPEIILAILGGLMLLGTSIGGIGSLISVRKFLRV